MTERARAEGRVQAIVEERDRPTLGRPYEGGLGDALGLASRPSPSGSRAGDPMGHLPLRRRDGSRPAPGNELVGTIEAMVSEPDDEPDDESDDEPDEEPDDEPDEDSDDEPDEESDDEPGTLYFDEGDPARARRHASRQGSGSDFSTTRSMARDGLAGRLRVGRQKCLQVSLSSGVPLP